ncbi:diacylglycerol/lipid kinase family protein [Thermogutta terrifontis]|uniref:diacylglycerol/lipid kinase family protein n=1 Tax=Thermogutta terrifontis TaxID=1331910 RepID=UPI000BA86EC3|nr:diacylglycerol kinase family protein [Thermogutta terrifontis]
MTPQRSDCNCIVILHNPKAGRWPSDKKVGRLVSALTDQGYSVRVSQNLGEAVELANAAFETGRLKCLIGAGGDGTAGELINRVVPGLPLSFFPTGTSNLVASYFGFSRKPRKTVETLMNGEPVAIDAGIANGRLFLVMLSCGFDAAAVEMVHRKRMEGHRGGRGGFATFIGPICHLIGTYPFPQMAVEVLDGNGGAGTSLMRPQEGSAATLAAKWVFVFNLPRYGWGLPISPEANGTDGLLDLCTYRGGGFWKGLWYTLTTQLQLHRRLRDFQHLRGRRFRITADAPVPYQLDGDPAGYLPVEVEVAPRRVHLVVPKWVARRLVSTAPGS